MPILGKLTSALLCSTMLGGPIMAAPAGSPLDEGDPIGAESLLLNEIGFAIDATTYDSAGVPYVGAPCGGTVAIKWGDASDSPADAYGNVALDVSNLVNSGTSAKMVHFPDSPYVRWAPHNYIFNSQTFGDADWTKDGTSVGADATTAPDGTSTADSLTETGAGTVTHSIYSADSYSIPTTVYTCSVYMKNIDRQYACLAFVQWDAVNDWTQVTVDLQNGTITQEQAGAGGLAIYDATITSVGSGWYRVTLITETANASANNTQLAIRLSNTGTPASADYADITYDRSGGSLGIYLWGAQISRGYAATPYLATTTAARIGIPQGYDTAAAQYGVLAEPAATNLCLRSEDFTTTWQNDNTSETGDNTTAPTGSTTADKITASSGTVAHIIYQDVSGLSSGTNYTFSVYLKEGTHRYVALSPNDTADSGKGVLIDLQTGTILSTAITVGSDYTYVGSSITAVGDGWHRCSITVSWGAGGGTSCRLQIELRADGSGTSWGTAWNAAGTETIYAWGAQLETGSVATSYIPTLGVTSTRAADSIAAAVSTYPHSATAGTVYVDARGYVNGSNPYYVSIDNLASTERIMLYQFSDDDYYFTVIDGGAPQADILVTAFTDVTTRRQATAAWAANDFDVSVDGAAIDSHPTGTIPTPTHLSLGKSSNANTSAAVMIYRMVYVPRHVQTESGNLITWRYNF
jgi:hypothetical protein